MASNDTRNRKGETMTKTYQATTTDIADELDRLCPTQVDTAISGNGQQTTGHIGHEDGLIGWYDCGGNTGHALCTIQGRLGPLLAHLKSLSDGALDDEYLPDCLDDYGIDWHV